MTPAFWPHKKAGHVIACGRYKGGRRAHRGNMWRLLGYKKRNVQQPRTVFSVDASAFESAFDAVVEASRLELVTGRQHAVQTLSLYPSSTCPSPADFDITYRLAADELPEAARHSVDAHRAELARLDAERDARHDAVAAAVAPRWDRLVSEFHARRAICVEAKEAASKSYVTDRGMSVARVREVHDANDANLRLLAQALHERGEKLVRAVVTEADAEISLDYLISTARLVAFVSIPA